MKNIVFGLVVGILLTINVRGTDSYIGANYINDLLSVGFKLYDPEGFEVLEFDPNGEHDNENEIPRQTKDKIASQVVRQRDLQITTVAEYRDSRIQ